jgi:phosphoribosylglycinamide formyltransferase 1
MRVGVLASGQGTNLQALIDRADGRNGVQLVAVGSDRADAFALQRGREAKLATAVFERDRFADRDARDAAIAHWLAEHGVQLVVLAGYMQLLSDRFLAAFPERVINVHPSLLPAFPGLRPVQQALDHGVKVFGVTVFFVDDGVDSGPIIVQRAIHLPLASDPDTVLEELHPLEHELLVEAVTLIAEGAVSIDPANPRRVLVGR